MVAGAVARVVRGSAWNGNRPVSVNLLLANPDARGEALSDWLASTTNVQFAFSIAADATLTVFSSIGPSRLRRQTNEKSGRNQSSRLRATDAS